MKPPELRELGVVKTATPCNRAWESMRGGPVKRYCGDCKLYVWNFEELTSDEARELLMQTEGRLCARIFTRADGTVLTRDCPRGLARVRRMAMAPLVAVGAWVVSALAAIGFLHRSDTCENKSVRLLKSLNPPRVRTLGLMLPPGK